MTRRDFVARMDGVVDGQRQQNSDRGNAAVAALLPWGFSLLMHLGLVLLAIFIVWSVDFELVEEPQQPPLVRLSDSPEVMLPVTAPDSMTMTRRDRRSVTHNVAPSSALSRIDDPVSSLVGSFGRTADRSEASPLVGLGPGQSNGRFFDTPGGDAKQIVYVIDGSGSLVDSMGFVMDELRRSIDELSDAQRFTVVFFQGDGVIEVPPKGMKEADSGTKARVLDWMGSNRGNVVPMGGSDPVRAMKLAFSYRPQLIYLLSDNITGRGRHALRQERLLEHIDRMNVTDTRINAVQFLYPDALEQVGFRPTLQLLSERTGGVYKFVDGWELGIR